MLVFVTAVFHLLLWLFVMCSGFGHGSLCRVSRSAMIHCAVSDPVVLLGAMSESGSELVLLRALSPHRRLATVSTDHLQRGG